MKLLIIDLLIKLKNASVLKSDTVVTKYCSSYLPFLLFLYHENLILSFKIFNKNSTIKILLKSCLSIFFFQDLKIISSPANSYFLKKQDLLKVNSKQKVLIFLTDKGLKTDSECKKLNLGGKILFKI